MTTDRRTLNRTQVRKSRRRAGGKGKPGETQSQSRRQRQGTVLFLSYVEEQKLRFQGGSHSATLRGSFRLASSKVAGPVPRRCRWSAHVGRRAVPQRPSPATAEPDAFSELDRGPLGGGTPPITASGATAGILSGPHAHPPEPAVSGTVNRAATTPSARAADPGAPLERRAAPQPVRRPSRTASGELARTAPGVVRTNWCGGAASSARSTGLPSVRNGAPQGFLWSFSPVSLSGGVLSAVAGFLLCAGFFRRSPATRATGLRTPPQKKRKTQIDSVDTRCRRCRSAACLLSVW